MLPRWLHRHLLRGAHAVRHRWRRWRKVRLEGVSVIARDPDGRILLIRHAYGPEGWFLPGGGVRRGEYPRGAAQRELREETGCQPHDLRLLGELDEVLSGSPHTAHVFICRTGDPPHPDRREVIEARFFATEALPTPLGESTRARLALLPDDIFPAEG